jgi:endonuclease/exonuclease/phosphatase family metal-dependent hydrolase
MKTKNLNLGIFKFSLYALMLFAVSGCKKSINPGDWDIIPPPKVVDPKPDPVEKKTITLKVMTYNAKLAKVEDFPTMISIIKEYNPDLLILRQVDSETTRANKVDRPKEVGLATGMNYFFSKAFDYQTGGYGNAVLSKYPIEESFSLLLPGVDPPAGTTAVEMRSLAMITIKIDEFNKIVFAGTELDATSADEKHRLKQANAILDKTKTIDYPVIFGGNFNFAALPQGDTYKNIKDQFTFGCYGTGCPLNTPKDAPTAIYDFITYKSSGSRFEVTNYATFNKTTSAFLPVVAELKLTLLEK